MKNKKIVFLGTPEFAANILEGLILENYNIIAVVSQPDKFVGRKKILTHTPVKEVALKYNIPVYQPVSLRKEHEFLDNMDIDMLITAAYGQILPNDVLNLAKINNINVHASLLPLHRGGAPIHRAIINGDEKTGVTIMKMVDKMDAGEMYGKEEVIIDKNINTTQLFVKLQEVGKELLLKLLPDLLNNNIKGIAQDETKATYSFNIKREEEKIDFNKSVFEVHNLIRGLAEVPGAYCMFKDKEFKIYSSEVYKLTDDNCPIGSIKIEGKNNFLVKCKDGYLKINEIKIEGKQKMDVKAFLNGCKKEELVKEVLS